LGSIWCMRYSIGYVCNYKQLTKGNAAGQYMNYKNIPFSEAKVGIRCFYHFETNNANRPCISIDTLNN